MKKLISTLLLLCMIIGVHAQKNANGVIYDKHPSIDVVEKFMQAFVKGDAATMTSLTTDDFKAYNAMNTNWDYKGQDLATCIRNAQNYANNYTNFSITKRGASYPDALEYKKDGIWVYTYNMFFAINKKSGFKIESPYDCTFIFNADGTKIKSMNFYMNTAMLLKNTESEQTLTNGIVYKNHPNIVKVRKLVSSFSLGNMDGMFADFAPNARFNDLNYAYGVSKGVEERKKDLTPFFENIEILGIDEIGYPDMIDHEGPGSVVDSWWSMRLRNKKTNKKFKIALVFSHTFNDQGQIQTESAYYNGSQLADSYAETKK
jgi:ketosteroid isomerase-like protein